jgi:paraquat-inducible protein A
MNVVICECCDAVYERAPLAPRQRARCERCGAVLYADRRLDVDAMLALTVSALLVLIVANAYPIVGMEIQGTEREVSLLGTVLVTADTGVAFVALLAALTVFLFPLIQLLLLLHLLIAVRIGHAVPGFVPVMHALRAMRPWSMVEVFMLGVLVSVVKLTSLATITPGLGIWGFALLTVLLTLLNSFHLEDLWGWCTAPNPGRRAETSARS